MNRFLFLGMVASLGVLFGCRKNEVEAQAVALPTGANECRGSLLGRPACRADFWDIQSRAAELDAKAVVVTGFLAVDDHMLALYASELDYQIDRDTFRCGFDFLRASSGNWQKPTPARTSMLQRSTIARIPTLHGVGGSARCVNHTTYSPSRFASRRRLLVSCVMT